MSLQARPRTVAILQPSYLPWLGHLDQIFQSDVFVLYDDVQFDKHGWRNRNRVKNSKGEPQWLTVPVLHKGLEKPDIKDILINKDQDWVKKHLGTVKQFYSKAPYFKTYYGEFEEILQRPWETLAELDIALVEWLCKKFAIQTPIVRSSTLGIHGGQTERLVKICQHFQAQRYLSGPSAKDYLQVDQFQNVGVEVWWHEYVHPVYQQVNGAFVSHLSSLDSLLNVGEESRKFFIRQ